MTRMNIDECFRAFARGDGENWNSTKSVRTTEYETGDILAYSYRAIIAHRFPDGEVNVYTGWYGYSVTTSCHLTALRKALEAEGVPYSEVDYSPRHRLGGDPMEAVAAV